jgi:hypothetical protein
MMSLLTLKIEMEKFYKLTPERSAKVRSLNLTASEWKVWAYLVAEVPFGDRYQKLPSTIDVLRECGIGKSTYYRAMAKLQDGGLFDFQDNGFSARNLYADVPFPELGKNSQNWDNFPRTGTTFPELGQLSQNWENQPPKPAHSKGSKTPQTIKTIKTIKTSSEAEIFDEEKMCVLELHKEQLARYGIYTKVFRGEKLINNPDMQAIKIFLGENESLASEAVCHFLGAIAHRKNVENVYALMYTYLKNFVAENS